MGIHFPNISHIIREVEHAVDGMKRDLQHAADGLKSDAEHAINKAANDARHDVEVAAHKAIDTVQDATHKAAAAALEAVSGQALKTAVHVVEAAAPVSFTLQIGPLVLDVDQPVGKIDKLNKWASAPPSGKKDILELVSDLAPTQITIQLSAEFALLFVASSSLGVGFSAAYQPAVFLQHVDKLLKDF